MICHSCEGRNPRFSTLGPCFGRGDRVNSGFPQQEPIRGIPTAFSLYCLVLYLTWPRFCQARLITTIRDIRLYNKGVCRRYDQLDIWSKSYKGHTGSSPVRNARSSWFPAVLAGPGLGFLSSAALYLGPTFCWH